MKIPCNFLQFIQRDNYHDFWFLCSPRCRSKFFPFRLLADTNDMGGKNILDSVASLVSIFISLKQVISIPGDWDKVSEVYLKSCLLCECLTPYDWNHTVLTFNHCKAQFAAALSMLSDGREPWVASCRSSTIHSGTPTYKHLGLSGYTWKHTDRKCSRFI